MATDTTPEAKTIPLLLHDEAANRLVRNYSLAAAVTGFIPVNVLSGAGIVGIQVMLIRDLCMLFDVSFRDENLNVVANSVIGTLATQLVGAAATSIPGVSAPMKGLSGAAIAGIYTATVGEFYKVHFQNGGNLENASIADIGKYFVEEYRRGDISLSSITNPVDIVKRLVG